MVIIILRKQIFEQNPNEFHLIDRASANVSLIDRNMRFFYQNPATNRMQILKYLKICKMWGTVVFKTLKNSLVLHFHKLKNWSIRIFQDQDEW